MKYLFFVNPAAGKGKIQRDIINSIKAHFSKNGGDYTLHITKFKGDAEKIARSAAQSGEEIRMYGCGGEGTSYEILNGIYGFDNVSLGVIPCGSANDFLKIFSDKTKFSDIEAQVNGEIADIDIIKAGDRYCMNGCSVGMDAMVAKDMNIFRRIPLISGSFAYTLAIIKNFVKKLGIKAELFVDGKSLGENHCLFAVAANAPYYGGGYMAAPNAVPNDGKLNFTLVKAISRFRVPKFLELYKKGKISHLDYCTLANCKSFRFKAKEKVPVNLDGEIAEHKELMFSIIENGVKLIIPKGAKKPEFFKKLRNYEKI